MKRLLILILTVVMSFSFFVPVFAVNDTLPFDNSSFFETGEYTLHYRTFEAKGEEKDRLFLIHGFCLSTESFEPLAEIYAENGYKTVLVDVPNFGYSSRERADMTLRSREEVISDLIKYLGGKWILGGHSMGGGIALNIAVECPDLVKGLLLFAPQTSFEVNESMGEFMRSPFLCSGMNIALKLILKLPCVIRYALVGLSFGDLKYAEKYDIEKITSPFFIEGTGAGIAVMSSHTRGSDLKSFSALSVPTAIVISENDFVANKLNLNEIIKNAPCDTKIVKFLKGGHMMMEYDPERAFLETISVIEKCK